MIEVIEKYIPLIYPDLKNNMEHNHALTLYKNGDFITPHTDGMNPSRYCVVLVYLNESSEYNDGGGRLLVGTDRENTEYVDPIIENFVILDFTSNEVLHAVEEVKNNFERLTYINFISNKKMLQKSYNIDDNILFYNMYLKIGSIKSYFVNEDEEDELNTQIVLIPKGKYVDFVCNQICIKNDYSDDYKIDPEIISKNIQKRMKKIMYQKKNLNICMIN